MLVLIWVCRRLMRFGRILHCRRDSSEVGLHRESCHRCFVVPCAPALVRLMLALGDLLGAGCGCVYECECGRRRVRVQGRSTRTQARCWICCLGERRQMMLRSVGQRGGRRARWHVGPFRPHQSASASPRQPAREVAFPSRFSPTCLS